MRIHGKALTKVLSIFTGATIAIILYSSQYKSQHASKRDRFAVGNFLQSHLLDVDLGLDASVLGRDTENIPSKNKQPSFITAFPNSSELRFKQDHYFHFSACPSSLQKKLQSHALSAGRYHPAVQMVMTSSVITEEDYHRMSPYFMPFGFKYRDEVSYEELLKTLQLLSEEQSIFDFGEMGRPSCVKCAVVGNGGMLNGSRKGEEIDSHHMVFRVNHCIRRGHEEDVGRRTTHYVFMDRSLVHTKPDDVPKDKGIKWLFLPCRKNDYKYISEIAGGNNPKQKLKAEAKDIRLFHPDFVRYVHKMWLKTKSFRPSTGAMMLFAALHGGCDEVSVYGMGFNKAYTEHYYDTKFTVYKNVKGSHDFAREIAIMKELDRSNIIHWYKRDVPEFIS
ncbi:alpha-N-acetylgalactosaminide alpha-2,6-sialyltransferase 2-like [Diadema antillarum]|uniref:alpha-N-acetylgalactosaminide alpha-2,6-sialyltransferase 2-like n=1 Tax=Diadema antillarum TaxID=105358 RepID=UPI003A88BC7C